MVSPHGINTKDPQAVAALARTIFREIGAEPGLPFIDRALKDATDMFEGRFSGYLGIDMFYHDFEHTLQATTCLLQIIVGRHHAGATPVLTQRDCELALLAVLLHDTGYLKRTEDPQGTGAKYTLTHVRRSCEFARAYLPQLDILPEEIEDITTAISCTGPANRISNAVFRRPEARLLACILVTSDYLGQMGASDYVDELPILFREFAEAYDFEAVPPEKRMFHSFEELRSKTPAFWEKYVRPMLDTEAGGVHQFLNHTGQPNPYFEAVEANIAKARQQT